MVLSFFILGFIGIIQRMQRFHKQIKSSWTWTWWFIKGMWMVHSVTSEMYMCWVSAKSHYLSMVSTFVMVCFTKKTRNLFGQCTNHSADNKELILGFFSFLRSGTVIVFWICYMSSWETLSSSAGFFKYRIATLFIRSQECWMVSEPNGTNCFPPSMLSLALKTRLLFSPCLDFLVRVFKVEHMQWEKSGVQKWKEILKLVNQSTTKSDIAFYWFKIYRWIFDSFINILPGSAELL